MEDYVNVDYSDTEIKAASLASLPVGYTLVTEGRSQAGDLPFYGDSLTWSEMPIAESERDYIGLAITEFWALARKSTN